MVDYKKTGQFIQTRRKERDMTQKQLAELLGVSDKTISKWETGKGIPDFSLIPQVCKVLEMNVNELLSGEALSSQEYPEKAEGNMLALMEKFKRVRSKNILYIFISTAFIGCSLCYMCLVEFEPVGWSLLLRYFDPPSIMEEVLFLAAFWLLSSGVEEKTRFHLARKCMLCLGSVFSLISLDVSLWQTETISELNSVSVGIGLTPIFTALCINTLLILLEVVKGKTRSRQKQK